MDRKWIGFVLVGIVLLLGSMPVAAVEKTQLIQEVLDLSGVREQLAGMPGIMQQQISQGQNQMSPVVRQKLMEIVAETFDTDKMYRLVQEYNEANYQEAHLLAVRDWLKSALGRKVTEMEIQSSNPEALSEMMAFALELQQTPPSDQRKQLVQDFNEVYRLSEFLGQLLVASMKGALNMMQSLYPDNNPGMDHELLVEQLRRSMMPMIEQQMEIQVLFTYRHLSNEEFAAYVEQGRTESGKWYIGVNSAALVDALNQAIQDTLQRLIEAIERKEIQPQKI